jgi:hypothetical protein
LVSSISDSPGGDRIRQWSGRVELLQSGGNWLASRLRASPVNVRTAVNWRTAKGLV